MHLSPWRTWVAGAALVAALGLSASGLGHWAAHRVVRDALPELAGSTGDRVARSQDLVVNEPATIDYGRPIGTAWLPSLLQRLSVVAAHLPGNVPLAGVLVPRAERFLVGDARSGCLALEPLEHRAYVWMSLAPAAEDEDQLAAQKHAPGSDGAVEWIEVRLLRSMSDIAGVALQ